jgi:hypothetical protein
VIPVLRDLLETLDQLVILVILDQQAQQDLQEQLAPQGQQDLQVLRAPLARQDLRAPQVLRDKAQLDRKD